MSHFQSKRLKKVPIAETRAKLLEIFSKAHPDQTFPPKNKFLWQWMDVYARLRFAGHAKLLDATAQAFGEALARRSKTIRALEEKIVILKKEVTKLQGEKHPSRASSAPQGTPPLALSEARREFDKVFHCLLLEVDPSIVRDVKAAAERYADARAGAAQGDGWVAGPKPASITFDSLREIAKKAREVGAVRYAEPFEILLAKFDAGEWSEGQVLKFVWPSPPSSAHSGGE